MMTLKIKLKSVLQFVSIIHLHQLFFTSHKLMTDEIIEMIGALEQMGESVLLGGV